MIKSKQLAQALYELSIKNIDNLDSKFFDFIEKRNLKAQMPSVLYHLERINKLNTEKNGMQIETAHPISKEILGEIKSFASKNISNDKNISEIVEMSKIQKDLIGGFRVKYNGVIYDASIMTSIKKLEERISSI